VVAAAVPAPAPAPAPSTIDLPLESEPPGATVTVDGVVVGTTPSIYRARRSAEPTEFAFALDGYRRESVQAIAAPGLVLRVKLRKAPRAPAARPVRSSPPKLPSPNDIKSER
jgi:serine/threonine-protein kinase